MVRLRYYFNKVPPEGDNFIPINTLTKLKLYSDFDGEERMSHNVRVKNYLLSRFIYLLLGSIRFGSTLKSSFHLILSLRVKCVF